MSLVIDHVPPSQRLAYRMTAPIAVTIGQKTYKTVDWSLYGFKIADYNRKEVKIGEILEVSVYIPFQDFNVGFASKAKVIDIDTNLQHLTLEYVETNERQEDILKLFSEGLMTGQMQSVDGVIKSLDVPVTPATLKKTPTAEEKAVMDDKRKKGTQIYKTAGVALAILFLYVLYTNIFQLKIKSAVLVSPTTLLFSPANGDVAAVYVDDQAIMSKGEKIMTFTDPELEKDIRLAELKVEEARINVNKAKRESYGNSVGEVDAEALEFNETRLQLQNLEETLLLREATLERTKELYEQGITNQLSLDKAQEDVLKARSEYLKIQKDIERSRSLLTTAQQLLAVAENELDILKKQRDRLTMYAPKDGKIVSSMVFEGGSVSRGNPVGVYEYHDGESVYAFITPDQATAISQDTKASVYFPQTGDKISMQVNSIDAVSGAIDSKTNRIVWNNRSEKQNNVTVQLKTMNEEALHIIKEIPSGSSAVVVFHTGLF